MRILVAEDDPLSLKSLESLLSSWGYAVVTARDGHEAWQAFQAANAPHLALIDCLMPVLDGLECCRRVRATERLKGSYVILLTALDGPRDIIDGLEAGANDYITKPFHEDELRVRIAVGARVVQLQDQLANRVRELEQALLHIKQLQGLLPICCLCKKIRDHANSWHQLEAYISDHAEVTFSHSYCPECSVKVLKG